MYSEDDLVPISALQHVIFCERQAALIHVERLWKENVHTVEGRHLHERIESEVDETRGTMRVVRGITIRSLEFGFVGVADVVEFRRDGSVVTPFPIEYKKGKRKRHHADEVQLCAQALCLEEMFKVSVPMGALFYGKTRRRTPVEFDEALRETTRAAARRFHEIVRSRVTPAARYGLKCRDCSLSDLCRPRAGERSASRYLSNAMKMTEAP